MNFNPFDISPGDMLVPCPDYNRTSGKFKIPSPVKVESVHKTIASQTGVLFEVRTTHGQYVFLDADWFIAKF